MTEQPREGDDESISAGISLEARVRRLEAIEGVRRLLNIYGYYMDLMLYDEVVALMADDCEIHFMGGVYRGLAGARRLFLGRLGQVFTGGHNRPQFGRMGEHVMLQEVITPSADGTQAFGRARHLLKAGTHAVLGEQPHQSGGVQFDQWIEGGVYENQYALIDGVWKFTLIDYRIEYAATVRDGWANSPVSYEPWFTSTYPDDPSGPDELEDPKPALWPTRVITPFHYSNPATGRPVSVDSSDASSTGA